MSTSMPASSNGLQRAIHLVALHGEQADLGLQREALFLAAADHLLIVPDDVFQREGNLLPGFVLDDVGNLLRFDRRQLDEPRQTALARDRDRHLVAADLVAREELLEGLAHQLHGVGLGLAEDLGVFDVVEGVGRRLVPRSSPGRQRSALSAHWPISIPHTASLLAMPVFPRSGPPYATWPGGSAATSATLDQKNGHDGMSGAAEPYSKPNYRVTSASVNKMERGARACRDEKCCADHDSPAGLGTRSAFPGWSGRNGTRRAARLRVASRAIVDSPPRTPRTALGPFAPNSLAL